MKRKKEQCYNKDCWDYRGEFKNQNYKLEWEKIKSKSLMKMKGELKRAFLNKTQCIVKMLIILDINRKDKIV